MNIEKIYNDLNDMDGISCHNVQVIYRGKYEARIYFKVDISDIVFDVVGFGKIEEEALNDAFMSLYHKIKNIEDKNNVT